MLSAPARRWPRPDGRRRQRLRRDRSGHGHGPGGRARARARHGHGHGRHGHGYGYGYGYGGGNGHGHGDGYGFGHGHGTGTGTGAGPGAGDRRRAPRRMPPPAEQDHAQAPPCRQAARPHRNAGLEIRASTKVVQGQAQEGRGQARQGEFCLDGKKVRALKGKKFAARVKATRLTAGKHRLVVRVKTRAGQVRTFKVRLKLA